MAPKKEILEEAFDADSATDWAPRFAPRFNVAPGQETAVVLQDAATPARHIEPFRWGLVPAWAKDAASGFKMINARAESVAERPAFREPLRSRRCLIPADGFYEWKRAGREKIPYCFTLTDGALFAFAGLWDEWRDPRGGRLRTCTILTTTPNELAREVHGRMPVILPPEAFEMWLDPGFHRVDELQSLLRPYPAEAMRRYRVSSRVNQVQYDDPACAAEVAECEEPAQARLFG